jgi:uncharacterized membrane protein
MWIRKSILEIQNILAEKEIKNKSLKRPIILGTIFGLLFMALHYFGFRGGSLRYGYVYTPLIDFGWQTVFFGVSGFILFFILAVYHQKKGWSFLSDGDNILRCDSCRELSRMNTEKLCQCSGNLEPSEFYSWEE